MKEKIFIPLLGIVAGELIMYYDQIFIGLVVHIINFLLITLILIFSNSNIKEKNLLQSYSLIIILRIINVSMPIFFTPLLQYSLIYGIMFVPIFLTIKNQHISYQELGLNFSKLHIYIPLAIMIGNIIAIIEYRILGPIILMQQIRFSNVIFLGVVMFIFIGVVEEIIFRSILQTRIEKILGTRYAIILSGSIFGIMHASYGILNEILFVVIVGIIMGFIFHRTKNLPFVISIHGVTNLILFGLLPKMTI